MACQEISVDFAMKNHSLAAESTEIPFFMAGSTETGYSFLPVFPCSKLWQKLLFPVLIPSLSWQKLLMDSKLWHVLLAKFTNYGEKYCPPSITLAKYTDVSFIVAKTTCFFSYYGKIYLSVPIFWHNLLISGYSGGFYLCRFLLWQNLPLAGHSSAFFSVKSARITFFWAVFSLKSLPSVIFARGIRIFCQSLL